MDETELELNEELEQPEPPEVDPTPAPPVVPDDVRAAIAQEAEERAYQRYVAEANARNTPAPQVDALEEAAEMLSYDPVGALRKVAEITRSETLREVAPHLQRVNNRDVIADIAGDLDPAAQQFVSSYAHLINASNMTKEVKDLFRNAAENVSSKARARAPEPTSMLSEPKIDNKAYAMHLAECRMRGIEPCTKQEFAELA